MKALPSTVSRSPVRVLSYRVATGTGTRLWIVTRLSATVTRTTHPPISILHTLASLGTVSEMNKERRKRISSVVDALTDALEVVRDLAAEEQEAFDAMPEGLQDSERGEAASEAAASLEEAVGMLEESIDLLGKAGD